MGTASTVPASELADPCGVNKFDDEDTARAAACEWSKRRPQTLWTVLHARLQDGASVYLVLRGDGGYIGACERLVARYLRGRANRD